MPRDGRRAAGAPRGWTGKVCTVADRIEDVDATLPANRRQTDPLALALFEVLRHHSETDRKHVLDALRFGAPGPDAAMRVRAIEALRLAEADLGDFPSFRRYEAWRLSQAFPHEWPSGSSIGRAWGRWSLMLDALGVKLTARPATVAMRSLGETLSREELLEAIGACSREVKTRPLTLKLYRQWAGATKDRQQHARIPVSSEPFIREFGGFAHAAREAGLAASHASSGLAKGMYTNEEIFEALRRCSREIGDRAPTSSAYRAWRRPLMTKLREDGEGTQLPSDTAVLEHLQTWAYALHAAGLVTEQEMAFVRRRASRQPLNERRVAHALVCAVGELGPQMTPTQYTRWRARQPQPFGVPEAPGQQTLVRTYARWPNLVATVVSVLGAVDPPTELGRLLQGIRR